MASGHVSRIKRPNTWLHRPMLQNVKKALANLEPSTHAAIALANKIARMVWAMMARGERYKEPVALSR